MTTLSKKELPYQSKGDLTTGLVHKHLIRLTVPMIWGVLSVISVQVADMYFISKLGTKELAAVSFIFPVALVMTHLAMGLSIATASVVSRLIGQKKRQDVQRVVSHSLFLGVVVSGIMALLFHAHLKAVFTGLGADEQAYQLIAAYMPWWLGAFTVMAVPVNGNATLRAGGDAMRPASIMIFIALLNLALDPLLIFGLYEFPALGVEGAAIATFAAYGCGAVLAAFFLLQRRDLLDLKGFSFEKLGDSARRLSMIAVPAGIANIIVPFTNTVIVSALALHGAKAVAAHGIGTRVEAFALIAVISLAIGMAPIIGQNWGAGLFDRAHKTLKIAIGFNMLWSLSIALLLAVFAAPIASVFSDDPDVVRTAILFFQIVPCSYAFGNLVLGWSSAFNAMGYPKRAFVMMSLHAALLMGGVFIGNALHGITGIFIAIAAVNIAAGTVFHFISRRACLQLSKSGEK